MSWAYSYSILQYSAHLRLQLQSALGFPPQYSCISEMLKSQISKLSLEIISLCIIKFRRNHFFPTDRILYEIKKILTKVTDFDLD